MQVSKESNIYVGETASAVAPVYKLACRLRFKSPTADYIIQRTKSTLDPDIVSAIIEAASRLLPINNSPEGREERQEQQATRSEAAQRAENAFAAALTQRGYRFRTEMEQRQFGGITPDIRFVEPIVICGHVCCWLEYKDYFGFRDNPFIAAKNKKQLRKYVANLGPGAVVFKLGYEADHLKIEGLKCFREVDVLRSLI